MAKRTATNRAVLTSLCAAGFVVALIPAFSFAQDAGGMQLRFGFANRVSVNDNPGLKSVKTGRKTQVSTGLSFGFLSETRDARLQFDTSARLRWRGGNSNSKQLANPEFNLSYKQTMGWDGHFDFTAELRETDLTDNTDLQIFDTGTGTRREGNLHSNLTWGDEGAVGLGISLDANLLRYSASDPGLTDSNAFRVGLSSRFDLTPSQKLDLGLSASRFDQAGRASTRTTFGFSSRLTSTQPDGASFVGGDIFKTPEGHRLSASVGHKLELPRGNLAAELGAARGTAGNTYVIGALDYTYQMPLGTFSTKFLRRLSTGSDDTERLVTDASAQYQRRLNDLSTLNLSVGWAESLSPQTGLSVTNGTATATVSRRLTEDWGFDVGYRHQRRNDERNATKGRSNTVFMELKRDVTILR